MINEHVYSRPWPLGQKVVFRFLFIYFLINILSFSYFTDRPYLSLLSGAHNYIINRIVFAFNNHVMHLGGKVINFYNNDDTHFRLVQMVLYVVVALTGTVIWGIIQRKQPSHNIARYWLKTLIRYFVALVSIIYGSVKLYAFQATFPTLSSMATPLGNFLPQELFWRYMGYSPFYQIFSGVMEVSVAVLLLYRRTATLGAVIGLMVYTNVLMINMLYDVRVKVFTMHLIAMCLYLLVTDGKRLVDFFILNRPVAYARDHFIPAKKRIKIVRLVLKSLFIINGMYYVLAFYSQYKEYTDLEKQDLKPIPYGLYEVRLFVKNNDTLPVLANDSLIWKDVVFEYNQKKNFATVNSRDTLLGHGNRRGLFYYKADTLAKTLQCYREENKDSVYLFTMQYYIKDRNNIALRAKVGEDSLYMELMRSKRKFKLAERQFHWVSEGNRVGE